jgi:hypothetical protein
MGKHFLKEEKIESFEGMFISSQTPFSFNLLSIFRVNYNLSIEMTPLDPPRHFELKLVLQYSREE